MSSKAYSGTMSGTGVPATMPEITVNKMLLDLVFAGTATVVLQWKLDGTNWTTYASYTASAVAILDFKIPVAVRLNCTAHTNNVDWKVLT